MVMSMRSKCPPAFVDRVVDDLGLVVQTADVSAADVHARPAADSLSLEDLDVCRLY